MSRSEINFVLLVYGEWFRAVLGHQSFRKLQRFGCVGIFVEFLHRRVERRKQKGHEPQFAIFAT